PARARRPGGADRRAPGAPGLAARARGARRARRARRRAVAAALRKAERRAEARAAKPREEEEHVTLPLKPPLKPQLALSRKQLPEGDQYVYEIKLDGFRCVAFVDGDDAFLQSRNGK